MLTSYIEYEIIISYSIIKLNIDEEIIMKSLIKLSSKNRTDLNKLPTKSSKIRFLNKLNFSRSEIAVELNLRYQHVRNVLITPIKNERK